MTDRAAATTGERARKFHQRQRLDNNAAVTGGWRVSYLDSDGLPDDIACLSRVDAAAEAQVLRRLGFGGVRLVRIPVVFWEATG